MYSLVKSSSYITGVPPIIFFNNLKKRGGKNDILDEEYEEEVYICKGRIYMWKKVGFM